MTPTTPKRPPLLTTTCLYLGLFAAIQAISAMSMVSTWNGNKGAEQVSGILKALRESGATPSGAETGYKVFLTVLAVLAAAGVVFAVYTARGDQASRIGLTIVMPIVGLSFFAGATGGSFFDVLLGALAIAFTTRLWRGEVKTWFRVLSGKEPEVKAEPPRVEALISSAASQQTPVEQSAQQHPVQQPVQPYPVQPYPVQQPAFPQYQPPASGQREALPKPVKIATWTTFVGSASVVLASVLALLVLGLVGDDYERLLRESPFGQSLLDDAGMNYDQMYRTSMIIFGLCLALGLAGLAAALVVLSKRRSGDVFLFVMASATVVTSILLFPLGVPFTVAAIVVLVQLRKPEARRWFVKT